MSSVHGRVGVHEEATPVVRPLTLVNIEGNKEGKGVADFLEIVRSEQSTFSQSPFVNTFRIKDLNYREEGPAFWEFCGSSIKSLHLGDASFPTDNEFGHALFQCCPNLEELYLLDVHVDPEGNASDQPVIWAPPRFPQNRNLKSLTLGDNRMNGIARMEIFSHFPCLEKLGQQSLKVSDDWVFQSLAICRDHDNQGWPLKSVDVNLSSSEEPLTILPVLVEGNLTLEEFELQGIVGPEGIILNRILETHANSLKKLTLGPSLDGGDDDVFAGLSNVRLEKLEFLELDCVDLSTTNFLRNLPNLMRLKMFRSHVVQPEDPNDDDWALHSCTKLDLQDDELEAGDLQNLIRRLPNLETLEMRWCDNELFAMICELCPKLTYLDLWGSKVDDCGISGLDKEDVERINQEGANGWTWWRPITVARPNLSNLKNLKWFRFSAREMTGNSLGFCAALCGVQQLPNLQELCLEPLDEFVEPIWKRLIDQFPWVDQ